MTIPIHYILILFFLLSYPQKNRESQQLKDNGGSQSSYSYGRIGQEYLKLNIPDSAKKYFRKALTVAGAGAEQKAFLYNNLGVLHYREGNYDSTLFYCGEAEEIYKKHNDTIKAALAAANTGMVYHELGRHEKALEELLTTILVLEKDSSEARALSSCYNTIANIFTFQKEYDNAILYHHKALHLRKKTGNQRHMASSYNNLGIIYRNIGNIDSALHYYSLSLRFNERLGDLKGMGVSLNNLGRVYLDQKVFQKAGYHFSRSLNAREASGDNSGMVITLNNMALLNYHLKDYKESLHFLSRAGRLIDSHGLLKELKNNLEIRLRVYEHLDSIQEALEVSKQLMIIKDSIVNEEKAKAVIEMQTKYESEKKSQELRMLAQKQEIQQAEIHLRQTWNMGFGLISFISVTTGLLIYHLWKKEKLSRQMVQNLHRELQHRIKNNLQLLSSVFSLQSRFVKDKNAMELLRNGENRINVMALLHQKFFLTPGSGSALLSEYVHDLMMKMTELYGYEFDPSVIQLNVESILLDADRTTNIALIISELASNTFKYSFPHLEKPYLLIEAYRKEKELHIHVEDGGPGFDEAGVAPGRLGLSIIKTLSRQMNGRFIFKTENNMSFHIILKTVNNNGTHKGTDSRR